MRRALALFALVFTFTVFTPAAFASAQKVGERASDFALLGGEGQKVALADFTGTPTVLNFWATWCLPCIEELPLLQRASEALGEEVAFVLINNSESAEVAAAYLEEHGITVRAGLEPTRRERAELDLDTAADVSRRYHVYGVPTTIFVDAQGVVRSVKTGPLSASDLSERLAEIGVVWQP